MPRSLARSRRLPAQRGVSLVELMVSLALGLVLIAGVLSLYLSSQQSLRTHQGLARVQENARLALDLMAREIRTAGVIPCGSPLTANVMVTPAASATTRPTPWWADTRAGFLRGGRDSDQGVLPAGTAVPRAAGTDSLILLRVSDDEGLYARVLAHDTTAHQFSVAASVAAATAGSASSTAATVARIEDKAYALVCDSLSSALFQVDTVQTSTGFVNYPNSPRNCTTSLGTVDAACGSPAAKTFPAGALLVPWEPAFWYVGEPASGSRALYRAAPDQAGTLRPVERVPGVESLQVDYLTRNRSGGGSLATGWVDATAFVGGWADPAREVVALRLTLTLGSEVTAASAGASAPLRRVFQSVVALRGMEP